jgi:AraC-like DNA-binding protein
MEKQRQDRAKYWIDPELQGLQLLSATFVTYAFPRHLHDTYVIGVQERGAEKFDCRGASRVSPVGSIALINPGEVHNGQAANKETWVYRAIYPDPSLLQEVASQCKGRARACPHFPLPVVFDRSLAQSLSRLHRILEVSPEALQRQTFFTVTMSRLITRHSDGVVIKPIGAESRTIKIARDYIADHYKNNISLKQLSDVTGLNPFYLVRAFRKEVGLPPHEFLTQVRIRRAMKLLLRGLPIAEVALETGFVDQSHLTNRFKRLVGTTPKQFAEGSISYKTALLESL